MTRREALGRIAALAALATLAACGKKDDPEPPPEEKVRFPRQYPRQSSGEPSVE